MKRDLPYFTHDNNARNHPKMQALRAEFGAAGYGQFWMLNEMIAQAEGASLDLSKKVTKGAVARELGMTFEQLESFLDWICDPEIDLVNRENGVLTTDRTQEDYRAVESKRSRDRSKQKEAEYPKTPEKMKTASENGKTASENAEIASEKHTDRLDKRDKIDRIPAVAENPAPDGSVVKPDPTSHKKTKKPKADLSQDEKDLRAAIRETFDSRNIGVDEKPRYANHALEGKKIVELATAIRNLAPDNPMLHAQTVLETYLRLTQAPKGTLSGKPFTASTLATNWILQEVIAEIRRTGDASVSVDDMVGEIESKRREREKTEAIA